MRPLGLLKLRVFSEPNSRAASPRRTANLNTFYTTGSCSGCSWGNYSYASGNTNWSGVGTIFGSPDALEVGGVWNATYLMYSNASAFNSEPGEYAATHAHNSFQTQQFQWIAPYFDAPSANATYDTTGAVVNGHPTWVSTSATAGRLISGNELYITGCASGSAPNCVDY